VDEKPDKPAADSPAELKARALRYLVRREHSRAELARKLAPHAESQEAVEALLDSLLSRKQLSDERFAEERARSLSRKYGPAKIRHDLKARGISDEIVDRLSGGGELERAKAILERKYRAPATNREETAKRARFLQGRGFSYDVIRSVLKAD
jgi:regulatory protein